MNWIILSLLAPAIYTVVNFIDKYVVEHKVKDSRGMPIYGTIVALLFGTAAWLIGGMPTLSLQNGLLVLFSGVISMWGFALYFYALSKSQTSYIIALLQTTPIFTLVFAQLFLDEPLNMLQLAGFVIVFAAILGLSIDKVERKIKLGSAFYAIIVANVLFAIASIAIKYTVDLDGFVPILAYESWGLVLGGIVLYLGFKNVRQAFWKSFRTVGNTTLAIMFLNESLFVVSKAITFLAISMGPVALVGVLGGTQVFYGFLYGIVLTLLFPTIFHEDIAKYDIIKKAVFSALLFLGVWFISQT
ncbi:MAG: hypothetical protein JWN82_393 [Candidatus Saccharibacteria bacterium]|nr:hypothetical protein [Candidatus Saccharibacteria bacterium]